MTTHSYLGPSSSGRWINCTGSVKLITDALSAGRIKLGESTYYSSEGTAAHTVAEWVLTGKTNLHNALGSVVKLDHEITATQEMIDHVREYVDFVNAQVTEGSTLSVEQKVSYTDWVPGGYGTADAVILCKDKITVIDLKYGKGVAVDAFKNTQALLYALGVYQSLSQTDQEEIQTVRMVIHQPRLDSVTEWTITKADMLRRAEAISQSAREALSENAPLHTGAWCKFCPALPICKAQETLLMDTVGVDFEDLTQVSTNLLSNERLKKALDNRDLIVAWLDSITTHVSEELMKGEAFPGYKMVSGRSLRQWKDEQTAQDWLDTILGDTAYVKKLISPPQAEKLLGKDMKDSIAHLVVKPQGKPTLAPESDPREKVNLSLTDFD